MTAIDCPICEASAHLSDDGAALDCDACGVATEIAAEATTVLTGLADAA